MDCSFEDETDSALFTIGEYLDQVEERELRWLWQLLNWEMERQFSIPLLRYFFLEKMAPANKSCVVVFNKYFKMKAQGEIVEGLVACLVSHENLNHMEKVLEEFPVPLADGAALDLGPSLRELCAANRQHKKQQIKALRESVGSDHVILVS